MPSQHSVDFRFAILRHAPRDLIGESVRKRIRHEQPYALNYILDFHIESLGHSDVWLDHDLYEVIDAMPTGNQYITRSTLLWALKALAHAQWRNREQDESRAILEPYLHMIWDSAKHQWDELPLGQRGDMLDPEILDWIERIYNDSGDVGVAGTPVARFDTLIHDIAHAMTVDGGQRLTDAYLRIIDIYPKQIIPGCVRKWFPGVFETIEAQRPKPLNVFQQIRSIAATIYRG